ncbi:hypothetical protein SK128_023948 [Halocaridina rubra]|uniref:Uncharacterized protein n=1 Tax=Halocaridina rubra TaxID=373956 RepID=A0AAN8ZTI8_HALRR
MWTLQRLLFLVILSGTVMAGEPMGCTINHLNSTRNGESWTKSFKLTPLVTLALRNPDPDPWHEIDIEFESKTGANVGTLKVENSHSDSSLSLTLLSRPTYAYKKSGKSQRLNAEGRLRDSLILDDWTYVNISSDGTIKVSADGETVTFGQVDSTPFEALYVRLPEGQELEVGFNCTEELIQTITTSLPGTAKCSKPAITIVGIISLLLIVGMSIFWYIGREKRYAPIDCENAQGTCDKCVDSVNDDSSSSDDDSSPDNTSRKGMNSVQIVNKNCEECGEVIIDDDKPTSNCIGEENKAKGKLSTGITITNGDLVDGECSCSDEENSTEKK